MWMGDSAGEHKTVKLKPQLFLSVEKGPDQISSEALSQSVLYSAQMTQKMYSVDIRTPTRKNSDPCTCAQRETLTPPPGGWDRGGRCLLRDQEVFPPSAPSDKAFFSFQ